MSKKKAYFAYLRVSSKNQRDDGTIENQKIIISDFLKRNNEIEITGWFMDDGISAFKERPQFDEMMNRINEVDGIIFTKLTRIGRSLEQLVQTMNILRDKEKDIICIKDSIDTSTPQGRFFFHILASFAEYEAEIIRERVREGVERAKAEGKKFGRKRKEFSQKQLNEMKKQYENGVGMDSLAKIYGCSKFLIKLRLKEQNVVFRKAKGA